MTTINDVLVTLGLPDTGLSLDQGLQALNSLTNHGADTVDVDVLRDLVNRVSADAPGSVTVLYSGDVNTEMELRPLSIINAMKNNGDNIRMITDSPAAKFLGEMDFKTALAKSLGVEAEDLIDKTTAANQFLEGPNGLWGDVSANFIDATKGHILTITGGADDSRIFSQRELERIQANEKIISVDGLERTHLSNMTQEQAYKAIKLASDTQLANLHIVVDAQGQPALYGRQIMIDSRDFFANVGIDGHVSSNVAKYFATNSEASITRVIELVPERWDSHADGINTLSNLEGFGRIAGKLSVGGSVLGLLILSAQVNAAETPLQKQQIIDDWVGQTIADTIAGALGSALLVGGVAAIATVSAPVSLGLAIVGGIAGSILGGNTVYQYIKDGVNTFLHDLKSWIFGETTHNTSGLIPYEEAKGKFDAAQILFRTDPLTLDLDGDGLETVGLSTTQPILFDHTGQGIKTNTGWVAPDDGFLVFDRNGNGLIDNGTELFGDSTPLSNGQIARDGFAALADQDSNQDGVINVQDASWSQLQVWGDLNQDGISQANELFSLQQLGITGFKVDKTAHSQVLDNVNEIADLGIYYTTQGEATMGSVGQMADINLINDTFHREFIDPVMVSQDVALLPDINGSGKLRDLHEAMMLSPELKQLVENFSQTSDYLVQRALIEDIITAWANTDQSYQTIQQRAGEHVYIAWSRIDNFRDYNHYTELDENGLPVYDQFWLNKVAEWDAKLKILEIFNGRYYFKLPGEQGVGSGATDGLDDYGTWEIGEVEYQHYRMTIGDNHVALLQQAYQQIIEGIKLSLLGQTRFKNVMELVDIQVGEYGLMTTDTTALAQYFQTQITQDSVAGLSELADFIQLYGKLFDSQWSASAWQQWIDNYHQLSIIEQTQLKDFLDILTDPSQLYMEGYTQSSLILIIEEAQAQLLGVYDKAATVFGNSGNDHIGGGDGFNYYFNGGSGDDGLYGGDGNDILIGSEGDDYLNGGDGNDLLHGGIGNDSLEGGYGINTYRFNRGDGQDIIQSIYIYEDSPQTETQIILDVNAEEIILQGNGDDLIIHIQDSDDQLTVWNGLSENSVLTSITFANAQVWTLEDIKTASLLGTEDADFITGFDDRADVLKGEAGDDRLYGNSGDDLLYGGDGSDQLYGGEGNDMLYGEDDGDILSGGDGDDTVYGGSGDDGLYGGDGNDILIGGEGDDYLNGGDGNDLLHGGTGNDSLEGGYGINTYRFNRGDGQDIIQSIYIYEDSPQTETHIILDVNAEEIILQGNGDDLIIHIQDSDDQLTVWNGLSENSVLTSITFANAQVWTLEDIKTASLLGTEDADFITGFDDRADVLKGEGGDDRLYGNSGDDLLYGGDGSDQLYGGEGNDMLYGEDDGDILSGGDGDDTVYGGSGDDGLYGGDGNDILIGGEGDDYMSGGQGNDLYYINSEYDQVIEYNKEGFDTVLSEISLLQLFDHVENLTLIANQDINAIGNNLANTIIGNIADNVINGGKGNDVLTGGGGADLFVFDTALNVNSNVDTIADFESGIDKIVLDNQIFKKFGEGNISLDQLLIDIDQQGAKDSNDYLIYQPTSGKLFYDSDGSGVKVAIHFATLSTKPLLSIDDFIAI